MLFTNKTLRKLELEGNNIGPQTAKLFGQALRINTTLRYLDLENNTLTADGEDNGGMIPFCKGLRENSTILSLNLANNFNDKEAERLGEMLKNTME